MLPVHACNYNKNYNKGANSMKNQLLLILSTVLLLSSTPPAVADEAADREAIHALLWKYTRARIRRRRPCTPSFLLADRVRPGEIR